MIQQVKFLTKDLSESENMYDKTLTLYETLGEIHPKIADTLVKLGQVFYEKVNSIYAGS